MDPIHRPGPQIHKKSWVSFSLQAGSKASFVINGLSHLVSPLCSHSCKSCCFLLIYLWFYLIWFHSKMHIRVSSSLMNHHQLVMLGHFSASQRQWSRRGHQDIPTFKDLFLVQKKHDSSVQRFGMYLFSFMALLTILYQLSAILQSSCTPCCGDSWGENSHISADLSIAILSIRVGHLKSIIEMKWSLWSLDRVWLSF